MGVKIAVVGGGSTYTPELVDGIARRDGPPRRWTSSRCSTSTRAARGRRRPRRADAAPRRLAGPAASDGDRDEALDGADFVLVQLRVGGQAARLVDETLPHQFGTDRPGDDGRRRLRQGAADGAGAARLAEEVARRSAPGAWIVDFTNPVGIVTQALLDEGHRAIGLCNVAIGLQRRLRASGSASTPDDVELEHVGLNHLSWERAVRVDGVDRLPELLERDADGAGRDGRRRRRERAAVSGALPSYYLRYYYATTQVLRRAASTATRGRGGHGDRAATCSSCTATRRSTRSRSCSSTAAAPSTARRPRS